MVEIIYPDGTASTRRYAIEVKQSQSAKYRRWRRKYGDRWESKFRERYETEMIEKNDTDFYVGNLRQFPKAWIVTGLFYPPHQATGDLFFK